MRYEDGRYGGDDFVLTRPKLTPSQIAQVQTGQNTAQAGQVTPPQITANQNNYILPEAELVRLSTDASRTITGLTPPRIGRFIICNVGGFDVVLAHQSASSAAENRIISPTAANYTLNPNESVEIIYDFITLRWRILAGTGA